MKTFSPSEAAFEGFRLIRRRPGAVAVWTLLYILFAGLMFGLIAGIFLPEAPAFMAHIAAAQAASAAGQPSPSDTAWIMPLMMKFRVVQWIVAPIGWAAMVILAAAIYRAQQRPQDNGFAYLRIGGDELRMFAVVLVYFVIGIAVCIGVGILGGIAFAALYMTAVKTQSAGWATFAGVVLVIAAMLAFIWLAVRLSLAWPITFAEKRVALFDSWRLTRGRFWSILGCYLLAWIFAIIISFVLMIVIGILALIGLFAMAGQMHTGATPDWAKLAPVLVVLGAIWVVMAAAISTVMRVIMTAPSMAIYMALVTPPVTPGASGMANDPWSNPPPVRSGGLVL